MHERDDQTEADFCAGDAPCAVEGAIRLIGGKWKLLIIRELLLSGPQRYNRLLEQVVGISSKVLSQDLAALTDQGIIERREVVPRSRHVEYALTARGEMLMPIFQALGAWHAGAAERPGRPPTPP